MAPRAHTRRRRTRCASRSIRSRSRRRSTSTPRSRASRATRPSTLRLPKGTYTIILELPGFRPVSKPITVTRSEGFIFTLERQAKPAVLDVRATSANDAATGAQLFVDGAPVGTVPARVEVPAGRHRVEVKKAGFVDWRRHRRRRRGRSAADGGRPAAGGEEGRAAGHQRSGGRRRLRRRRAQGRDAGADQRPPRRAALARGQEGRAVRGSRSSPSSAISSRR